MVVGLTNSYRDELHVTIFCNFSENILKNKMCTYPGTIYVA